MRNPKICPLCKGTGKVPRKDLPLYLKGALGIRQEDPCPLCEGIGYVRGS